MRQRAFTLIELLVVIAIIAILAAILFPVFNRAKTAALQTQSISNLKQIGLATQMYTNDNDDTVPNYWQVETPINGGTSDIKPVVKILEPYIPNKKMWVAPGDPQKRRTNMTGVYFWDGRDLAAKAPLSYSYIGMVYYANNQYTNTGMGEHMGGWVASAYRGGQSNPVTIPRRTSNFSDPAGTIMWTESYLNWRDDYLFYGSDWFSFIWGCETRRIPALKDFTGYAALNVPACNSTWQWLDTNKLSSNGYNGRGVQLYVDGHAKAQTGLEVIKTDFAQFKVDK